MCKGKGLFKKLLAVTAVAGAAALLITKFKKNGCKECEEDGSDDNEDCFDGETDTSARNYVPLSHGEEEVASEEETVPEEPISEEEVVSKEAAPSAEEIAAKLEEAVADTEARYEDAAKDAEISGDK